MAQRLRDATLLMGTAWTIAACGVAPTQRMKGGGAIPPEAESHEVTGVVEKVRQETLAGAKFATQTPLPIEVPVEEPKQVDGRIPSVGPAAFFTSSGNFSAQSGALGTASYSGAPVIDWNSEAVPAVGTGAFDVTVGGQLFSEPNAYSVAGVFDDGAGRNYLVVSAWNQTVDPATQAELSSVVHVIVPAEEFAPGATIVFDGYDRLAYFASGDINYPDPQFLAVATTGSVTFGSGGLNLGDLIDASVSGEFSELPVEPSEPIQPSGPATPVPAGSYHLAFDPTVYVYCDGSLAGQESLFQGVALSDLQLTDGPVAVTDIAQDAFEISGGPIATGFGGGSLLMEHTADYPENLYAGIAGGAGPGPAGTSLYGVYLAVDSTGSGTYFGSAGAGYVTADQLGFCQIDFAATLMP